MSERDERPARAGRRVWLLRLGLVAVVLGMVLLPPCARVAYEGRQELRLADEAREADEIDIEIIHLGRAARWRLPGWSHDEDARERLMTIGYQARDEGQEADHIALAAFREVRRALWATRVFGVADPDQLREANENIADLMAAQEDRFGTDVGGTGDARAWHLERLEADPGPIPWRATAAAVIFLAWIAATVGFVSRGLDAAGRLRPRPAVRWGGASLLLLVAWAVLLARVRG